MTTWAGLTYMQDMTPEACNSATVNDTKQLIDIRDNKSYWVTKLKDNNCWMTQNLAIIGTTINSTNSDMTSGSYEVPRSSSYVGFSSSTQNTSKAYYDINYGGYYNWFTATAGNSSAITTDGANVGGSICPKGWRLPPSSGNKSYSNLLSGVTTTGVVVGAPYYFVYGGYGLNDEMVANEARYWTSTAAGKDDAYNLYLLTGDTIYPADATSRYLGNSVRCVAR